MNKFKMNLILLVALLLAAIIIGYFTNMKRPIKIKEYNIEESEIERLNEEYNQKINEMKENGELPDLEIQQG